MKKSLFVCFGILFALPGMAMAADTLNLSGILKYASDKQPVAGAALVWKLPDGTTDGVTADDNGKFEEKNVAISGAAEVTVSMVGCKPQTYKANDLTTGKDIIFNCETEELDAAIVIGEASSKGNMGCDNEDNEFIAPDLALCTTHAYNIGEPQNPTNETTRAYMRDVIALKATFMTQQMNKQYEYLESMIRRFKTQLEKAILTTRLQASGAGLVESSSSGGGSSSFKSNDRSIFISGVENCDTKLLPTDVLSCLSSNLTTISNMSINGSEVTSEVRKQFGNDYKLLTRTYDVTDAKCATTKIDCTKDSDLRKKQNFQECMDNARSCIRDKMYKLNLEEQRNRK